MVRANTVARVLVDSDPIGRDIADGLRDPTLLSAIDRVIHQAPLRIEKMPDHLGHAAAGHQLVTRAFAGAAASEGIIAGASASFEQNGIPRSPSNLLLVEWICTKLGGPPPPGAAPEIRPWHRSTGSSVRSAPYAQLALAVQAPALDEPVDGHRASMLVAHFQLVYGGR